MTAHKGSMSGARARWRQLRLPLLFLLPALAVYTLFVLVPIAQAMWFSLFHWNGLGPLTDFVGLDNYARVLNDRVFQAAVWHNALIVILSLLVQIPFALWLALMLNESFRGRTVLRLIFFAPYVLSEIITGVVWRLLLYPGGMVDQGLGAVGGGGLIHEWMADRSIVMFTLFVVITWKYFGFHMIIMLAGLQGIPRELEEAAAIDGASHRQTIRKITLPLLGPTIRVSVFLSIIGAVQLFDLVWATTKGGPANASNTMATYLFDVGILRTRMGYGSAVAVILFVVCLVVAVAYVRLVMRRETEGARTAVEI